MPDNSMFCIVLEICVTYKWFDHSIVHYGKYATPGSGTLVDEFKQIAQIFLLAARNWR